MAAAAVAVVSLPVAWGVVAAAGAFYGSPLPDRIERLPRGLARHARGSKRWWWRRLEPKLRILAVHRRWTHWLSTGVVVALVCGAAITGLLVGYLAVVAAVLDANTTADYAVRGAAVEFAAWLGVFTALGVAIGYGMHSYLDGWTMWGSPMWGLPGRPETQERVHVVGKRWWITKRGEKLLRGLCVLVLAAVVYVQLAP